MFNQTEEGLIVPILFGTPSPFIQPEARSTDNSFTYLLTPRLKVSPVVRVYGRLASGYRAGGPNPGISPGLPTEYGPDKSYNYEVGIKADALHHAFSLDASVYYIDWRDIQLTLSDAARASTYLANAGRARSQGVEVAAESRPVRGMLIAGWATLTDAVLSDDLPAGGTAHGVRGDRLPYSTRFSGNVSVDQEFRLGSRASGFAGAALSFVGERKNTAHPFCRWYASSVECG